MRSQLAGGLGGRVPVVSSLAERGDVGAAAINALGAAVAELQSAVTLQLGFALASIDAVVEQVCAADCVER